MLRKSTLVALCLVVFCATMITAASFTATVLPSSIATSTQAMVQFKFADYDLTKDIVLRAQAKLDEIGDFHFWNFKDLADEFTGVPTLQGYREGLCYDETSKQVVAQISRTDSRTLKLSPASVNQLYTQIIAAETDNTARAALSFTINCPVVFANEKTVNNDNLSVSGTDFSSSSARTDVSMAVPSGGFMTPVVNFKAASLTSPTDDPSSSTVVSVEFTTDTAGLYVVSLTNGPKPYPANQNNGAFADWYCSSGSTNNFARIRYPALSSSTGLIHLYVPTVPTASIKCKFLYDNLSFNTFVKSERLAIKIAIGEAVVSRNLQSKSTPAGIMAVISQTSTKNLSFHTTITSTSLPFSSTPINNNSTIVFAFSKHINVARIEFEEDASSETSYQANLNCYKSGSSNSFRATSSVDKGANAIVLKDLLINGQLEGLRCSFNFNGSDVFDYQNGSDMASVTVSIDGKTLASVTSTGNAAPLYLRTIGTFDQDGEHEEVEDNGVITVTDITQLTDNYAATHTKMGNPLLVVSINGDVNVNVENFASQLIGCQSTAPHHSRYEELKLKFDPNTLTWSTKLSHLTNIEAYSVLIKCSRKVNKVMKYGLDITPLSNLRMDLVNLLDGSRYFTAQSFIGTMPARTQSKTQTGQYPTAPLSRQGCIRAAFALPAINNDNIVKALDVFTAGIKKQLSDNTANSQYGFTVSIESVPSIDPSSSNMYYPADAEKQLFDMVAANTNNLKSYYYGSEIAYANINPQPVVYYSNENSIDYTYYQCFIAQPSAQATTEPDWSVKIDKAQFSKIIGTDIVHLNYSPLSIFAPETEAILPHTCGVSDGFFLAGVGSYNDLGLIFSDITNFDNDAELQWSTFTSLTHGANRCLNGATCTVNADCHSSACKGGVCTTLPTYPLPYVNIELDTYSTKAFDADYFNNSFEKSIFGALAIIIVAMMF